MEISKNELYAFWKAKKVTERCPMCGGINWATPSEKIPESDDEKVDFAIVKMPISNSFFAISSMPLICENCGFVRFQNTTVLYRWVLNHRETAREACDAAECD